MLYFPCLIQFIRVSWNNLLILMCIHYYNRSWIILIFWLDLQYIKQLLNLMNKCISNFRSIYASFWLKWSMFIACLLHLLYIYILHVIHLILWICGYPGLWGVYRNCSKGSYAWIIPFVFLCNVHRSWLESISIIPKMTMWQA